MTDGRPKPDLCVIGGSEAGLAVCLGAAALGLVCVLVDDGDSDGLRNPDLALATLARVAASGNPAEFATTLAKALTAGAADRRHARFAALNIRILRGTGRFLDASTLAVEGGRVTARRFVIATGGCQPSWPLAETLGAGVRLSVADLCRLRDIPATPLVCGGTAEAVSTAQSFARLGCRVSLLTDALLPDHDPESVAQVEAQLHRDGVSLLRGTLKGVKAAPAGALATLSDGSTIEVSHLVLAEEPRPALHRLDLARADLAEREGALMLDGTLRTSKPHIFAVGRAAGALSTAEGLAQAAHVLRAMLTPLAGRLRPDLTPLVTATRPEIAQVGRLLPEPGTRAFRTPLPSRDGDPGGLLKVVVDRRGRVVGAVLVGTDAREMLPFWSLAIARGLTLGDLAGVVPPTASASEAVRAIVVQDLARRLASPWARRALRFARRFG